MVQHREKISQNVTEDIRGGQSEYLCVGSDFGSESVLGIILLSRTVRKCRTGTVVKPPLEAVSRQNRGSGISVLDNILYTTFSTL